MRLLFFIFISLLAHSFGSENGNITSLEFNLINPKKILDLDIFDEKPRISPDGKYLAWVVSEKPMNAHIDLNADPLDVFFVWKGAKILIRELTTNEEIEISTKNCWGPSWSHDGESLAYYSDAGNSKELWIFCLKEKRAHKVANIPLRGFYRLVWSKDNKEIYAFMISDQAIDSFKKNLQPNSISSFAVNLNENFTTTLKADVAQELVAINVETGQWKVITPGEADSLMLNFAIAPSGHWMSSVSKHVQKQTGTNLHGSFADLKITSLQEKNVLTLRDSIPLQHHENGAYAWHPTLDYLYYFHGNELWLAKFSSCGLIAHEACFSELGKFSNNIFAFTKDFEFLIVGLAPYSIDDYWTTPSKIALIPVKGGAPKIYSIPAKWTIINLIQNADRIAWQPDAHEIALYVGNSGDPLLKAVVRINLENGHLQLVWKGNKSLSSIGFSPDHHVLYSFLESYDHPCEIYQSDIHLKNKRKISHTEPLFDMLPLGKVKFFESLVPGKEGQLEKVKTAIILPPGTSYGQKLPAVVVHYPGSNCISSVNHFAGGDNINGFPNWILTTHNIAVILPNLVFGEEVIGRPLEAMTSRLLPQIYQASNLGYIDLDRVGIMGQSYGAYGTAGIISHTNLFRAAVAANGAYDLASFSHYLDEMGNNFWMTWAECDQGSMGQSLFDDIYRYINNSPFYRADKIHTPLLLIHGGLDDAIQDAKKLFSALRRLNRYAELAIYHQGHHCIGNMRQKDHFDAVKRIFNFFHRHLVEKKINVSPKL